MSKIQGKIYCLHKETYTVKEVGNIILEVAKHYGENSYQTVEVKKL